MLSIGYNSINIQIVNVQKFKLIEKLVELFY